MIVCPVCQRVNHHLATVCSSCGSFVQPKVDTLDLFATAWRLLESPQKAFLRIALATHKNYIWILGALSGIAFVFSVFWTISIGDSNIPLINLLAVGFLLGPFLGIINLLVLGTVQQFVAMMFRLKSGYKNTLAVIAYAAIPIVLSVIFILPIEILTFGNYFFSTNPSPYALKPFSYVLLLLLDGLCLSWSLLLYVKGLKTLYNVSILKATVISCLTIAIFTFFVFLGVMKLTSLPADHEVNRYFTTTWAEGEIA